MLGLKMDKPKRCLDCPVRMNCQVYLNWLSNVNNRLGKPMKDPDCLLVDLDHLEDDLK